MKEVFLATAWHGNEGFSILGIFSTFERADQAARDWAAGNHEQTLVEAWPLDGSDGKIRKQYQPFAERS